MQKYCRKIKQTKININWIVTVEQRGPESYF